MDTLTSLPSASRRRPTTSRRRCSVMARLTLGAIGPSLASVLPRAPPRGVNDCKHRLSSAKRHREGNRVCVRERPHAAARSPPGIPLRLHRPRAELRRQCMDYRACARLGRLCLLTASSARAAPSRKVTRAGGSDCVGRDAMKLLSKVDVEARFPKLHVDTLASIKLDPTLFHSSNLGMLGCGRGSHGRSFLPATWSVWARGDCGD